MLCLAFLISLLLYSSNACSNYCIQCSGKSSEKLQFLRVGQLDKVQCFSNSNWEHKSCKEECYVTVEIYYPITESVNIKDQQSNQVSISRGCGEEINELDIKSTISWERKVRETKYVLHYIKFCGESNCNNYNIYERFIKNRETRLVSSCQQCEIIYRPNNINVYKKCNKDSVNVCNGWCYAMHHIANTGYGRYKRGCIKLMEDYTIDALHGTLHKYGKWKYALCESKLKSICNNERPFLNKYHAIDINNIGYSREKVCLHCTSIRREGEESSDCEKGRVSTLFNMVSCDTKCVTYTSITKDIVRLQRSCKENGFIKSSEAERTKVRFPDSHREQFTCKGCESQYVEKRDFQLFYGVNLYVFNDLKPSIQYCKHLCSLLGYKCSGFLYKDKYCVFFEKNQPGSSEPTVIMDSVAYVKMDQSSCEFYCITDCIANEFICNDLSLTMFKGIFAGYYYYMNTDANDKIPSGISTTSMSYKDYILKREKNLNQSLSTEIKMPLSGAFHVNIPNGNDLKYTLYGCSDEANCDKYISHTNKKTDSEKTPQKSMASYIVDPSIHKTKIRRKRAIPDKDSRGKTTPKYGGSQGHGMVRQPIRPDLMPLPDGETRGTFEGLNRGYTIDRSNNINVSELKKRIDKETKTWPRDRIVHSGDMLSMLKNDEIFQRKMEQTDELLQREEEDRPTHTLKKKGTERQRSLNDVIIYDYKTRKACLEVDKSLINGYLNADSPTVIQIDDPELGKIYVTDQYKDLTILGGFGYRKPEINLRKAYSYNPVVDVKKDLTASDSPLDQGTFFDSLPRKEPNLLGKTKFRKPKQRGKKRPSVLSANYFPNSNSDSNSETSSNSNSNAAETVDKINKKIKDTKYASMGNVPAITPKKRIDMTKPNKLIENPTKRFEIAKPTKRIERTNPTKRIERTNPTKRIERTNPTKRVEITNPTKRLEITKPTETIKITKPTKRVQFTIPTETIEITKPTKSVHISTQRAEIKDKTQRTEIQDKTYNEKEDTPTRPTNFEMALKRHSELTAVVLDKEHLHEGLLDEINNVPGQIELMETSVNRQSLATTLEVQQTMTLNEIESAFQSALTPETKEPGSPNFEAIELGSPKSPIFATLDNTRRSQESLHSQAISRSGSQGSITSQRRNSGNKLAKLGNMRNRLGNFGKSFNGRIGNIRTPIMDRIGRIKQYTNAMSRNKKIALASIGVALAGIAIGSTVVLAMPSQQYSPKDPKYLNPETNIENDTNVENEKIIHISNTTESIEDTDNEDTNDSPSGTPLNTNADYSDEEYEDNEINNGEVDITNEVKNERKGDTFNLQTYIIPTVGVCFVIIIIGAVALRHKAKSKKADPIQKISSRDNEQEARSDYNDEDVEDRQAETLKNSRSGKNYKKERSKSVGSSKSMGIQELAQSYYPFRNSSSHNDV